MINVTGPAYLTVGTEVSAKYRGAFCEAKIKTVKRTVKVKVRARCLSHLPGIFLQVGSTVEVKSAEGICSEATINKLTDASWYTVVFDDGDEKTLRRTSLCLKGERHFAESETLDQLPLTNPEHFGTPVIGKKGNRGGRRSSQAHANDDKESSSSDDDSEDRRRLNDNLLGKVASIQTGTDRTSWYLALVISPSCNDDLTVKKDQCLVRSFADSKFRTVSRKEIHEVNMDSISKAEFSLRNGLDEAVHFLKTKVVPDSWKMDMSEILESSSSDEEDKEGKDSEEEEEEEEKEDDEPEDEADPEERDHFLQQLYKFMEDRGTPINKPPVLGYKDLNLFKLFRLVYQQGGCDKIESGSVWKQIYMDLGIPILNSAASYNVKTAYRKYLYGFEEYCRSACIVFRTIHHNEARPASQSSQSQTEQKAAQVPEVKDKMQGESVKELYYSYSEVKEPVKLEKIKVQEPSGLGVGETSGEERGGQKESSRSDGGDTQGNGCSRRLEESDKESEDEGEDEDSERRVEGAEDEDSVTGTKVKVKYGRGKTQKIYEANIKKTENDDAGDVLYLVHYYGWNVRYDEWVKADRIIWPVDKGGTKNKQKKKVMNKEDGEKDKQGKLGGLRGRPLLRTTPPSANRSVSKTPSREGRSSSKSKSDTSPLPNGEDESGNSSEDSESEESPEKKPAWAERTDPATARKQEEEEDLRVERGRAEAVAAAAAQAAAQLQPPSSPKEKEQQQEDKLPEREPEKDEAEEQPQMPPMTPEPDRPKEEDPPNLKSPRPKASRRSNVRDPERNTNNTGSEISTTTPNHTETESFPSPGEGGVAGGQPRSEQPDYGAEEELMPQIGPEALVCHEVDLDDLDEKDKTSAEDLLMMMSQGKVHAPPPSNASSHQTHNNPPPSSGGTAPPQVFSPTSAPSPDESISTKSESDVTIEVDSVAGESQEGLGDNESANSNCFEANTSSSNSSVSLQERDTKDRGQKRLMDCNMSCSAKKQKRNQKRPSTTSKMEKNGAGKSSDSEDLAVMDPSCKMTPVKHSMSKGSLKLVSPNSKELEKDKHKHKQSSFPSPRTYKWTFQLNELDSMTSAERISFLQDKLQDIRKYYMSLKSEVASIDRRRKRLKKKEREVSHTTASTSSGSSDTGMSPSSASPTQNTVVVECR
uniref:AT-rich interactive domain 4A n=1 Tax=Salmo trutta TaxID=8032 RepID=A0A674BGF2_SALTR